jgi:pimeloyl-ACP methyl ester carboxylesterase
MMIRVLRSFVLGVALTVALAGVCGCASAEPFRADVQRARVGGSTIAWYSRGSGPPLVMAIGTGSTMSEWDPALIRLLAAERRVIVFDYPGIGLSSALPRRPTSFAELADTLSRFMRAIGVPRADVLGWSMGGFVAQQLAVRHPERIRRLVLAGTNPGGRDAVLGPPSAQAIDSDPNPSDAAVLRVLYPRTAKGQKEGRRFLERLGHASDTGEIPDDFDVPRATVDAQVRAEDPWLRSDVNAAQLKKLRIPTLATGGTHDQVTPPLNMRRIAARIPGARLALFPGAHAFLFQSRDAFARTVTRFLAS